MKTLVQTPVIASFAATAHQFSERKAVVDEHGHLTYAQLDKESEKIADTLLEKGFGAGQVAVILMNRTRHAISSMIAILKAGGTYLPLEPSSPFLRNKRIVIESGASLIITTEDAMSMTGQDEHYQELVHVLNVDTMEAYGRDYKPARVELGADAAYIIYTSGSTGTPKGAINTHRSLLNLVQGLNEEITRPYDKGETLNIAVLAPFVFDPSIQQIYSALLYGHALHIVPENVRLDGRELLRFLNRADIDIADGTPTHLKLMSWAPQSAGNLLGVKLFIIGGEPLSVDVVRRFWSRFADPQPAITNIYGVAECCVDVTHYRLDRAEIESLGFVSIGKPFANMKVMILGYDLNPVGDRESGELCIGEPSVGNGYVGKPKLTAEKFVTNPNDGRLIYRTGDRVRMLDGSIEFLGRYDRQVKLRGYRIELGEIESVIRSFSFQEQSKSPTFRNGDGTDGPTCTKCLMTSRRPGVTIEGGICSVCQEFEGYRSHVDRYFRTEEDFRGLMEKAAEHKHGDADILLLYSGGKDSTYVLFRLIEMGYKVETFTFDNGFISKTAFENIHRITNKFGIRHLNCTIENMKRVFAESLSNSSTVCNGCFRALTMLSTKVAYERGINVISTGLSRGQIFDTKLKVLYESGIVDPDDIDQRLMVHRKIFYSQEDTVSKALAMPQDASIYDINYVDFFRYSDVSAPAIRNYLAEVDKSWVAPKDTGLCSTNCMINNVGIYVHKLERGYHNYVEPVSWDVRLGVTSREEARKELQETIDLKQVNSILKSLNYKPKSSNAIEDVLVDVRDDASDEPYLIGWFVSSSAINITQLRQYLASRLTDYMVPRYLVRVDEIPITHNGKIDYDKLPIPEAVAPSVQIDRGDSLLSALADLWVEVLDVREIGLDDNFFDLGGNSLAATILVGLIEQQFNEEISVIDAVKNPTIRKMATFLKFSSQSSGNADSVYEKCSQTG